MERQLMFTNSPFVHCYEKYVARATTQTLTHGLLKLAFIVNDLKIY